jgi:hypothetical protein
VSPARWHLSTELQWVTPEHSTSTQSNPTGEVTYFFKFKTHNEVDPLLKNRGQATRYSSVSQTFLVTKHF